MITSIRNKDTGGIFLEEDTSNAKWLEGMTRAEYARWLAGVCSRAVASYTAKDNKMMDASYWEAWLSWKHKG